MIGIEGINWYYFRCAFSLLMRGYIDLDDRKNSYQVFDEILVKDVAPLV
jgi:hypothetical protein